MAHLLRRNNRQVNFEPAGSGQTLEDLSSLIPLPLSSHTKPVDSFPQARELKTDLKREVRGEVRFEIGRAHV